MTTAFQQNAFQDDAFQIDDGGQQVVVRRPTGGAGWRKGHKELRRGGLIYWPRKTKSKDAQAVVAEVVLETLEQVPVAEKAIDVGALAGALIQSHSYAILRQVESHEEMIRLIKRELDEWDDEDSILLLL